MRAALLVVLALAVAGGLAYVATDRGGSAPRERAEASRPGRAELLQQMLDRRAAALERADPRALAATATGAQKARDRRSARRLRGLGVRRVELRTEGGDVRKDRLRLRARLTYGVRGIRGRFAATMQMTVRFDGRSWRVRSSGARRGRLPWEVAPLRRVRSDHFVIWSPRDVDLAAGGLEDALERGYTRMREVLARGRLRRRYLVLVAGDARQARALTARISGVATLAAITDTQVRQEGPAERVVEISSQRLLVVWPAFLSVGPEARDTVIAHELTHAALARATSGRTPSWLVEGLALYVSGDDRTAEAARLIAGGAAGRTLSLTGLSDPDVIARLDGEAQNEAYAYSSAAAFHIVDRYGQDALLDLYDVFNRESLEGPRGSPRLTDAATRRVLGVPLRRLERELRVWVLERGLF